MTKGARRAAGESETPEETPPRPLLPGEFFAGGQIGFDGTGLMGANPTWEVRLGDCLDPVSGLASLGDKSVDHVITDPPYSEALYSRTRTNRGRADLRTPNDVKRARELADLRIGAIDPILDAVAAQIRRVARRWIVVFHDVEIGDRWRAELAAEYVRTGAWVKTDPMPQVSGDRPAQGFEPCTIAHGHPRKRMRWNGGGRAAVWFAGREQVARPDHPCPKPIALMESLIRDFTDPGDLILDPFAGSGTTGVAAKRLGRRFLGWERDPKYHAIAVKRIAAAREQLGLAIERPPQPKQASLLCPSRSDTVQPGAETVNATAEGRPEASEVVAVD